MRYHIILPVTGLILLIFSIVIISSLKTNTPQKTAETIALSPTPQISIKKAVVFPIAQFKERITKKTFAMYISPSNSPVTPERFTGYHTGVDVEYEDITGDVPVYSIADGTVVFSGIVSGYGGVMVIQHKINDIILFAVYGHLRPSSMLKVNTKVIQGEEIAVLGTGYTKETDRERRHLHFGIAKVNTLAGYTSSLSILNADWINPLSLY